jgi:hypothetical protein
MHKKMEEVTVSTSKEGMIHIEQPTGIAGEEGYPVIVHPDQVDTLVLWLLEAKRELVRDAETPAVEPFTVPRG